MGYDEILEISVAAGSYKDTLEMAISLSPEDRLRLIHELTVSADPNPAMKPTSLLELCGLGSEIWQGIDAQKYVREERAAWNG